MKQWDGMDYQLWSRFFIVIAIGCLIADKILDRPQVFGIAMFALLVAIGTIPEGPKPPD